MFLFVLVGYRSGASALVCSVCADPDILCWVVLRGKSDAVLGVENIWLVPWLIWI